MSMNAVFVQVDDQALRKIQADPSLAETLFQPAVAFPPQLANLSQAMQERVRAAGPQMMAKALEGLDPRIRQRLEERLGHTASSFAAGAGGDELLKLMQERGARAASRPKIDALATFSLDKEWHGVHYLLCGEKEPGKTLLSKAVLGGSDLGDDDEGFSGYGPARCFTPKQVAEISAALSRPETERESAARFDAAEMSRLDIYPGWNATDAEQLIEALRSLRAFYAGAAEKGLAMVTCLV